MEVQGIIKLIGQTQQITQDFSKRELVLTTDLDTQYPQHILIQFVKDKCSILDNYQVGQEVKVSINIQGREWQSPQGEIRYFNTIQGWKIEAVQQQQTQYQQNHNFQQNNQFQQGNFQQQSNPGFNQNNGSNFNQQ